MVRDVLDESSIMNLTGAMGVGHGEEFPPNFFCIEIILLICVSLIRV